MMFAAVVVAALAANVDPPSSSVTVGNLRVTGLSPTLIRVEPKGPMGFEDRTTFMVRCPTTFNLSTRSFARICGVVASTNPTAREAG